MGAGGRLKRLCSALAVLAMAAVVAMAAEERNAPPAPAAPAAAKAAEAPEAPAAAKAAEAPEAPAAAKAAEAPEAPAAAKAAEAPDAPAAAKAAEAPEAPPPAQARQAPIPSNDQIVCVIPLEGLIDRGLLDSVLRRLAEARALEPSMIVFRIDTYGGLLDAAIEITDTIGGIDQPLTVAFVPTKAISAGAMIAMGAREIVLTPNSSIGDAAPVMTSPEGPKILGEKIQSPVRNMFRKYAQRNGYPVALVEAMVTLELEVVEVTYKDGTVTYMLAGEFDDLAEADKTNVDKKRVVVREGEILTLTATEAKKYGIARFVVKDIDELLKKYSLASAKVVTLEVNWSETMVRWLNHPAIAGLILLVGLLGLYMEFKMPGFGLPGGVAIVCFAILLFSKYLTGLALKWEILVFVAGVILMAIEVFVIPGFGVAGFAGITLMLAGLFLAFVPSNITTAPIDLDFLARTGAYFVATLAATFVVAAGLTKLLPHTPVVGKFFLGPPKPEAVPHAAAAAQTEGRHGLVGKVGRAQTQLRPAGRAKIGGEYLDVTTEGGMIAEGSAIEVVAVRGNNIIVRQAK